MIILWHGAIVNIPSGFVLCDGTHGTPDLRDKFLVGAGNGYAVGANGGNVNHNHDFTGDGHTHLIDPGTKIQTGTGLTEPTHVDYAQGTTDNGDGRPPYYALAYIMKT